jgi:site-specific DNA-methyltransferase (adenine-specific)
MTKDPKWNKSFNEKGKLPEDVWYIPTINAMSKERTGYPTQKPLALLQRIILGCVDITLDTFLSNRYRPL